MRSTTLLAVAAALVLAACGSDAAPAATDPAGTDLPPTVPTEPPRVGGPHPQAAAPDDFDETFRPRLSTRLELDDRGCWSLAANGTDMFVVLPVGFELAPGGGSVVSPDGDAIRAGSPVDAIGALYSIGGLPGGPEGRLGTLAEECRPGSRLVAVTSHITLDDFDPTAMDDAAIDAAVRAADWDVDWPCGFGFATSTADQRVGLYVEPAVFEQPPAGTVSLPDAGWRADVVVGKHLFVNHCDDVAEWFEPDRVVAATFPLNAGTFEFVPPEPGTAPSDQPVTIVIDGAVVDGPTGPIPLGTVTIVNDAYGFFAG